MKPDHINDSVGIKLPTRLRLSFSHLHKNKFRHNFKDTLNSFCSCSTESGTTTHFFLCCHFQNQNEAIHTNNLENIDQSIPTLSEVNLADLLFYGNENLNDKKTYALLICTINFLEHSQRFPGQLL